jgi:hypothetical protein
MTNYPLRGIEIRTYGSKKWGWKAQFGDGRTFPIVFSGQTEADVVAKAEAFRAEAIEKHEAKYLARKAAAAKARQSRKRRAA